MSIISRLLYKLRHLGFALVILVMASAAWGKTTLLDQYHRLKNGGSTTLPGTHINLASTEQDDLLSAEVNSILHTPFETVAAALSQASNWCQVLPLHFNIKACTFETREGSELLTIYSGRKIYEHPEDSYEMAYQFEIVRQDDSQLSLLLKADHGPMGTSDYRIELEVLRVEEGTLLHIHSSYRPSWLSSMLTSTYLSTVGRNKVGFSIIERNVMRYQLAIKAFLDTQSLPETTRHEVTLISWFKQNDSYPQLHEMDEAEYLEIKREEWDNQQHLQQALNSRLQLAVVKK